MRRPSCPAVKDLEANSQDDVLVAARSRGIRSTGADALGKAMLFACGEAFDSLIEITDSERQHRHRELRQRKASAIDGIESAASFWVRATLPPGAHEAEPCLLD
jgi:hypothetical protein